MTWPVWLAYALLQWMLYRNEFQMHSFRAEWNESHAHTYSFSMVGILFTTLFLIYLACVKKASIISLMRQKNWFQSAKNNAVHDDCVIIIYARTHFQQHEKKCLGSCRQRSKRSSAYSEVTKICTITVCNTKQIEMFHFRKIAHYTHSIKSYTIVYS